VVRIETNGVFATIDIPLRDGNLGNYGELVEFLVLSRCCNERERKRFTLAHSFLCIILGRPIYLSSFCFLVHGLGLSAIAGAGLPSVFGTGVALYFGALFGSPMSWLDGLLLQYFVSPRQASGVFRGPGIHVMIRFKEIFGIWEALEPGFAMQR
jgi:hypothetical protein